MSWLCRDPEIWEEDWDLLRFKPRESRVLTLERQYKTADKKNQWTLSTNDDWEDWLNEDHLSRESDQSSRINLILGGRFKAPWGHDPGTVSKLPWSKQVFGQIKRRFLIHSLIVRTINRNTSCMFSRMKFNWTSVQSNEKSFVYNCRSAASWPNDMALTVTFLPDCLTTNAVLFGCDMENPDIYSDMTLADEIISRLTNSDVDVFHPMLIPTIFAETERDRQIELVREKLKQLGRRVTQLTTGMAQQSSQFVALNQTGSAQAASAKADRKVCFKLFHRRSDSLSGAESFHHIEEKSSQTSQTSQALSTEVTEPDEPTSRLWLEISRLRIGLGNWQTQLHKMISHVEELDMTEFALKNASATRESHKDLKRGNMYEVGVRIRERLQELVDEYDEYIRECTHIMDGMGLATQLEISHIGRADAKTNQEISRVNLDVARMARQDGSMMKSIAVLGMIFLPASLVTAFFSMDLFDWVGEGKNLSLSSSFWIYAVAVVALTLGTIGTFYFCIFRDRQVESGRGKRDHSHV